MGSRERSDWLPMLPGGRSQPCLRCWRSVSQRRVWSDGVVVDAPALGQRNLWFCEVLPTSVRFCCTQFSLQCLAGSYFQNEPIKGRQAGGKPPCHNLASPSSLRSGCLRNLLYVWPRHHKQQKKCGPDVLMPTPARPLSISLYILTSKSRKISAAQTELTS